MDTKFGWSPKVGDRVEGVGTHGGTGHFGTVATKRRDGYVIEWDKGGKSVHQSYGFRKVEKRCPFGCVDGWVSPKTDGFRHTAHASTSPDADGRKIGCPIHNRKGAS
jgi:hypothetical protein